MKKRVVVTGCISLIFGFALFGCGGPDVQRTPKSLDTQAKTFTPIAGCANIYVFKKGFEGSGCNYPVVINGNVVGAVNIFTYLLLTVPPGSYDVSTELWGRRGSCTFHTEADRNYFVMITGYESLSLVDEDDGRKAMRDRARAEDKLHIGELQTHTPTEPEKIFQFIINTQPSAARVIVNQNGIEHELGMTPYLFKVGLAGRYEYWPIRIGDEIYKGYIQQEYILCPQEHPIVTVREISSINEPPELDLKCKLVADGFKPQYVKREIIFKIPCSPDSIESCVPLETDIVVGLNQPTQPEYIVTVKIDSIPSGADIYGLGTQGYLSAKLGTTPAEFEIGFANRRSPFTGDPDAHAWFIWPPNNEDRFVTWLEEGTPCADMNFVLLKDGYARQDVTRWTVHTPDVNKFHNAQKTITIPLKTYEEAQQERLDLIEDARTRLAAALKRTELELKQSEIINQQKLIQQQELISKYLAQLNTAVNRINTSSPNTIIVKQDPHYNREWQESMAALGTILRPHSKLSPIETEKNIQALEGLGSLIDLMNR
jgi:hypothetical protein